MTRCRAFTIAALSNFRHRHEHSNHRPADPDAAAGVAHLRAPEAHDGAPASIMSRHWTGLRGVHGDGAGAGVGTADAAGDRWAGWRSAPRPASATASGACARRASKSRRKATSSRRTRASACWSRCCSSAACCTSASRSTPTRAPQRAAALYRQPADADLRWALVAGYFGTFSAGLLRWRYASMKKADRQRVSWRQRLLPWTARSAFRQPLSRFGPYGAAARRSAAPTACPSSSCW